MRSANAESRERTIGFVGGCRKIERRDPDVGDGGSTSMIIDDAIPFKMRNRAGSR